MKKFKDPNNNDQVHEIEEGFEHLLPNGYIEIDQAEYDALTAPTPLTPQEIEDNKTARAQELSSSPQMQAAIEEFVSVLQAASIPVPADISANIINRCKAKL